MLGSIVLKMAHTLPFGMSTILDFATFLVKEIYIGLVGIAKGKVDKPLCGYSMLMYICLHNELAFFSKSMELEITKHGENNLVQLPSVDMTSEAIVRFFKFFASRLRSLLRGDSPRILQALLELVRPKDHAKGLLVSHNLGDIIPYNLSTIIRVYGFLGEASCVTISCASEDRNS